MPVNEIHAMMGFIVLFMFAVAAGFFLCYFLVKEKLCPPPPPPPEPGEYDDWLWQFVNEDDDKENT